MEEITYKVYVQVDSNNVITKIESSLSQNIDFSTSWTQIDEGTGDKYAHAQSNYFTKEKSVKDMQGKCNYKLVDGKPIELTDAEKESLFPTQTPQPSVQDTLNAQLLKANAEQQTLNANLLKQLAQLQGGSINA